MPQPAFNLDWYDTNGDRPYPLDDTCLLHDDAGTPIPSSLLVDAQLRFPWQLAKFVFCSAISVGPRVVSISLTGAQSLDSLESDFVALGVLTLKQPVTPHRPYAIRPFQPGVGGWLVLGSLVKEALTFSETQRWRFRSPRQSFFAPRTARPFRVPLVLGFGKYGTRVLMSGQVRFQGDGDLEIVKSCLRISHYPLNNEIYPECPNAGEETGRQPVILFRLKPDYARPFWKVLEDYSGPVLRSPEQDNCIGLGSIEQINTVRPDCCGNITIELKGHIQAHSTGPYVAASYSPVPHEQTATRFQVADGTVYYEFKRSKDSPIYVERIQVFDRGPSAAVPSLLIISMPDRYVPHDDPVAENVYLEASWQFVTSLSPNAWIMPPVTIERFHPAPWGEWTSIPGLAVKILFGFASELAAGERQKVKGGRWLFLISAREILQLFEIGELDFARRTYFYPTGAVYGLTYRYDKGGCQGVLLGSPITRRELCAEAQLPDAEGNLPKQHWLPCMSASASDSLSDSPVDEREWVLFPCQAPATTIYQTDFSVADPAGRTMLGKFERILEDTIDNRYVLTSAFPDAGATRHLWLLLQQYGWFCYRVSIRAKVRHEIVNTRHHLRVVAMAHAVPAPGQSGFWRYFTAEVDWDGKFGYPAFRVGIGGSHDQVSGPFEILEIPEFVPYEEWRLALTVRPLVPSGMESGFSFEKVALFGQLEAAGVAPGGLSWTQNLGPVVCDLPQPFIINPEQPSHYGLGADYAAIDVLEFKIDTV